MAGAAGAEHKSHCRQDRETPGQIYGGKGGLAGKVGHEESVHHPIDGGEDHHADGRQGKADQPPIGKVI